MRCESVLCRKIKKDAKVILYGAGVRGKRFWEYNNEKKWCEIVLVVDTNWQMNSSFPVPVSQPDLIKDMDYDLIIISVKDLDLQEEIIGYLFSIDVPMDKICTKTFEQVFYPEESCLSYSYQNNKTDRLQIGFYPKYYGLGDQIIILKVYQEICNMISDIDIDVYTTNREFTDAVYKGQPKLRKIIYEKPNEKNWKEYDVFLEISAQIFIRNINVPMLKRYSESVYFEFFNHYKYQMKRYVDSQHITYLDSVMIRRAKIKGLNRYSLYGESGLFDIKDCSVNILLDKNAEKRYQELELGSTYITYNYGAQAVKKGGKSQIKMWPAEYHRELTQLIKTKYPDITVVQIGARDCDEIPGADRYILGENLEVIKHILRNSVFHFDCEGGLVHLASQLGTKCVVVFGPTPEWYIGYTNNINITSRICGECMGTTSNWFDCYCYDRPECMYSITPKMVMEKIIGCISELNTI